MSIAKLTRKSATKFTDLRDSVEEAQARVLALQRRIAEVERQIRNQSPETGAEAIAHFEEEFRRLSDRRDHEQHAHVSLARVVTAVQTWIMQLAPSVELQDTEAKFYTPDLDGSSFIDAVERCHADIVKLGQVRHGIARSLLPVDVLYAQADAHVASLIERGRPTLTVDKDKLSVQHSTHGYGSNAAHSVVFLAWLHPEAMRARLREEIDAMRASEAQRKLPVLSAAERKAKLAEIDAKILAISREEEFYICEAVAEGTIIPRRDNALPEAVLGVEVHRVDAATRDRRRKDDERRAVETGVAVS